MTDGPVEKTAKAVGTASAIVGVLAGVFRGERDQAGTLQRVWVFGKIPIFDRARGERRRARRAARRAARAAKPP